MASPNGLTSRRRNGKSSSKEPQKRRCLFYCGGGGVLILSLWAIFFSSPPITSYTETLNLMDLTVTELKTELSEAVNEAVQQVPSFSVSLDYAADGPTAASGGDVKANEPQSDRSDTSRGNNSPDILSASTTDKNENRNDPDADCPFRSSPLYRKVYVYPNPGEEAWTGDILSKAGRNSTAFTPWPWLEWDRQARENGTSHYDMLCQHTQYTTELLVREVLTHPKSCLRTYNPEEATLFWVPYMSSPERHQGTKTFNDMKTSPYGQAIMDLLDKEDYQPWEETWGLTSKYWKRKKGADHILVYSEPLHGLWHPRSRRGSFHYVNSQKMLQPPIAIGVEVSTTFVEMYPHCARKNIIVPYPNPDGRWFNGKLDAEASAMMLAANITLDHSPAILASEKKLAETDTSARPVAQFYSAGNHGECRALRVAMMKDYRECTPSFSALSKNELIKKHGHAMRYSTFCPCPGGDSPSAKRMFDALLAGCIPVILSHDFVWPFTKEFDPELDLDPADFSVRLVAKEYDTRALNSSTCQPINATRPGLQAWMDSVTVEELLRLRKGVQKARDLYGWYKHRDSSLPDNPLREGILPEGGNAHALVQALADRANGARWPACEEELKLPREPDPKRFKC